MASVMDRLSSRFVGQQFCNLAECCCFGLISFFTPSFESNISSEKISQFNGNFQIIFQNQKVPERTTNHKVKIYKSSDLKIGNAYESFEKILMFANF